MGCSLITSLPNIEITHHHQIITDLVSFVCFVGSVIGLEFNGDSCVETLHAALNVFQQEQICDFFCSESRSEAEKQIENFYNYADMQMAV